MPEANLRLDHVNMPARDPEGLARWYAKTFGLQAEGRRVSGPGLLMVFQSGEPVQRAPDLHLGLRVPSMSELSRWADQLGGQITNGTEFATFRTFDPEGNCLEIYCKAEPPRE
jgi:catechol 2,3-dioxygenase-like lactoylglutathione lyase family enzyme